MTKTKIFAATLLCCDQGWEFAHRFSERITHFLPKNERMSHSLKKTSNSLVHSFLVSYLSDSLMIAHFLWAMWATVSDLLTLLIFSERPERFTHIAHQKRGNEWFTHFSNKNFFRFFKPNIFERSANSLISSEWPEQVAHSRSFVLSDLSDLLTVAHFLWATWAIRSRSLICLELSEQIAHSRSFDLSERSSEWANERWANEQIPSPGCDLVPIIIYFV